MHTFGVDLVNQFLTYLKNWANLIKISPQEFRKKDLLT